MKRTATSPIPVASTTGTTTRSAAPDSAVGDAPPDSAASEPPAPPPMGEHSVDAPPTRREDRIRDAAYRRFEQRGGEHGKHTDDWLEAENEIEADDPAR